MKVLNNLLVMVVLLAEISMFLTKTDDNSLKFVVELNKLLVNTSKIIDNYCGDRRISCNSNGQINRVELYGIELSAFSVNITLISDTLNRLTIARANLKGNIPDKIYKLTKLQHLNLGGNKFNGSLNNDIKNMVELINLNLSESNLSGPIPDGLYSLNKLQYLNLGGNRFNGSLNDNIRNLSKLYHLDLNGLNLSGSIPDGLYTLNKLKWINFGDNKFNGSLDDNIRDLNKLYYLNLSGSNLSGAIPDGLYSLTELERLDLSNNNINGSLSSGIGNLTKLLSLDLSFNELSGTIPNEIGNLAKLIDLEMRENEFEGDIPDLSGLKGLFSMNISSTKHSLNVKCDNKMLPPFVINDSCLIRPVSKLCNNAIICEYSNKPIGKSSVNSIFCIYGLKAIIVMLVYIAGIEMMMSN